MFNKYPTEFEEMYKRIVVDKEAAHEVIVDYGNIMDEEKIGIMNMTLYLGKYMAQRRRTCENN
jgi:hypothetical protein